MREEGTVEEDVKGGREEEGREGREGGGRVKYVTDAIREEMHNLSCTHHTL